MDVDVVGRVARQEVQRLALEPVGYEFVEGDAELKDRVGSGILRVGGCLIACGDAGIR